MSDEKDSKKEESTKGQKAQETKEELPVASHSASSDEEVVVPEKFKNLVEQIEQMSVLDLSELIKILEKKFGVSAAAPIAVAGVAAGAADASGAEEEKSFFDVELTGIGDNKIAVIKVVREVTGKGLKDAKDMTEGAPVVVKEGAKKEEAEEIKKKLEEAGASVTLN